MEDQELLEVVQSLKQVPEIYEVALVEAGMDSQEAKKMLESIKNQPEETLLQALSSKNETANAFKQIYKANKDKITAALQQKQNVLAAKNGAKLEFGLYFLKKGSKLQRENAIHKEYKEKLEKTGRKSSKEMEDLTKERNKKIQNIRKAYEGMKNDNKSGERTDVRERPQVAGYGPRGGRYASFVDKNGNRVYELTRDEAGVMTDMADTYYPYESSRIIISPDGKDTTGVYRMESRYFAPQTQRYVTQNRMDAYRTLPGSWLYKDNTFRGMKVIPEGWWGTFNGYFPELIKKYDEGGINSTSSPASTPAPPVIGHISYVPDKSKEYKTGLPFSLTSQNRGGGGSVEDYGEPVTDENGLTYRDVRETNWNSMLGTLEQSYRRHYIDNRALKKYIKKNGKPMYSDWDGYGSEVSDSLKTVFNDRFGDFGTVGEDGYDWNRNDETLNRYYPHFKK